MAIELNIDDTEVTNLLEKSINQYLEDRFQDDQFVNKLSSLVNQAVISRLERLDLAETVDKVVTTKLEKYFDSVIDNQATTRQLTITDSYVVNENELITRQLHATERAVFDNDLTVNGTLILKGKVNTDNESWMELKDTITTNVLNKIQSQTTEQLTEDILTLAKTQGIGFDNVLVNGNKLIDGDQLTPTVTRTTITEVGGLTELEVKGFTTLNNETLNVLNTRVGINTDKPTMALELWDQEVSMSMGKVNKDTGFVGLAGKGDLHIGINQQGDIRINEDGLVRINKLRIGRNNVFWADRVPGHQGLKGDIVFNSGSNDATGWRCTGGFNWNQF
jgi:hypothetical protein